MKVLSLAMHTTIPAGHVLRAPTADDAGAVAELLRAREAADLGEPEMTVADVLAEWSTDEVDLERDASVVEEHVDRLVAYALVVGGDLLVAIHPDATGRGLGTQLRLEAERRARARGTRVVRQFVPTANTAARALLLEGGWWPVHHYFRMLIALTDAPPAPRVLARTFEEHDTEPVWHLVQGAYADVEGHLPQSLEGWRASTLDKPGWDPGLTLLLHDANGILGVAIGERGDTGHERFGLVTTLAVADRARGRGHGRTLLLLLLDAFRRRRLRFAEAAVHGPTAAAARLFESVGMTAARRTERWEKVLGV
jgi:ribosomal protein S18 acetylase RimI-like enzyme